MVEAGEKNAVHSTASRRYAALCLRRHHATGKLTIHDRHVSWVLPFRLSGYAQNRFQEHTRNRVVLGNVQGIGRERSSCRLRARFESTSRNTTPTSCASQGGVFS